MSIERIIPMEPLLAESVPEKQDFIHEVKWDGIRGLTYIQNGDLKLYTKNGIERSLFYPELSSLPSSVDASSTVLDGELVVFDENGNPSFNCILARERVRNIARLPRYAALYQVVYIVFDILHINGKNLCSLSLHERKLFLEKAIRKSETLITTDYFSDGKALFSLMKQKNWEGIVSKNLESTYTGGKKHSSWFKIKPVKKLLAIICGINYKESIPKSLILGILKNGFPLYIGNAGTGLDMKERLLLQQATKEFVRGTSPFQLNSSCTQSVSGRDDGIVRNMGLTNAEDIVRVMKRADAEGIVRDMNRADTEGIMQVMKRADAEGIMRGMKRADAEGIVWLEPVLTCWVKFMEYTPNGNLRHPVILGFSKLGPEAATGKEYTTDEQQEFY